MTHRSERLGTWAARGLFGVELVLAVPQLFHRGPDVVAIVVASILVATGLLAYVPRPPGFLRLVLEQITRGVVLFSGLIVSIFWTIKEQRDLFQQWLVCLVAAGAGLFALTILKHLESERREAEFRTLLLMRAADPPAPAREAKRGFRWTVLIAATAIGALLGRCGPGKDVDRSAR